MDDCHSLTGVAHCTATVRMIFAFPATATDNSQENINALLLLCYKAINVYLISDCKHFLFERSELCFGKHLSYDNKSERMVNILQCETFARDCASSANFFAKQILG